MSVHYDDLDINRDIRLDLPFREGAGVLRTQDVAPLHHPITLVSAPAWTILDSYLGVLTLDGVLDYLWGTAASTGALDFTSGDYSLGGWFFISSGEADDKTLMCRFLLNNNGWELYHYTNQILSLRHHHAATLVGGNPRSSVYSENWAFNKWWFMGVSRTGASAQFYRGDEDGFASITTIGTLVDPEPCNQNLFVGNDTTGVNLYNGLLWRPRAWARALTQADWQWIWEREVRWFRS